MKDTIAAAENESVVDSDIKVEPAEGDEPKVEDGPPHPYLEEIMKCPSNDWQLEKKDPVPFKSLEEMPYTLVDTKALLDEMMVKLRAEKEIALGTRRFTYRSFNGISCMIVLATRSEAYLVDTIALKEEVKVLNEIFTNSSVLKIIHTGEGYIENLQRDLGLYMVNLFTVAAARKALYFKENPRPHFRRRPVIPYSRQFGGDRSMGALLKEHCSVDLDSYFKEYRTAGHHQDWHLRPITDEKIKYARIQVQYLLHIYDKFRNMLIDQNLLADTYQKCNEICKQMWYPGKYVLHPKLHMSLYRTMRSRKRNEMLTKLQMEVFRVLYDWRHTTAEKLDEGRAYLLNDLAIYDLAKALPKDVEGIKNEISPAIPSPLLEENLEQVCELISKAVSAMSGAPDADEIVPYFPGAKNSKAGVKRRNGGNTGQNDAKKKPAKVQEPLEAKHPVSALAEYCSRSKKAMPEYTMVSETRQEKDNGWRFKIKVVVDAKPYEPNEPSTTKKHAKAMAASVALKQLGLIPADANFFA